jgi:hypothetical protein
VRAILRLTHACNNRCLFCAQSGLPDRESLPLADELAALRATGDELSFVGGEPGLADELTAAVASARAAGFRAIGLQTNGTRLAERAAALASAGLTDVHVSLHGASAAEHDYHTGVPGSFARLTDGVAAARAAGLRVVATTVVTRSNFRTLSALPPFLFQRGVSAWSVSLPRVAGAAAAAFDRVVPRLALALPFTLHAIEAARTLGLPAFVDGAPLCLLGSFAGRALASTSHAYAPVCASCPARAACPGIDEHYLARFGADELHAVDRVAPHPADGLTACFVGIGASSPAAPPLSWSPPAVVRRSLPLYGKVQAAEREVGAAAPRKSGEALRELFPGLFDDGSG